LKMLSLPKRDLLQNQLEKIVKVIDSSALIKYIAKEARAALNTNTPLLTSDKEQAKVSEDCSVIAILI